MLTVERVGQANTESGAVRIIDGHLHPGNALQDRQMAVDQRAEREDAQEITSPAKHPLIVRGAA